MKFDPRHSLYWRIVLSYPLLGLIIGLSMIVFLFFSFESLERDIMDSQINEEIEYFIHAVENDPKLRSQVTRRWRAYVSLPGQAPDALPFTRGMQPGTHEIEEENKAFSLGIVERKGRRYTLIIDDSILEEREHALLRLLVAVFVLTLLMASWLGFWVARRVIWPITNLSKQVEKLDVNGACNNMLISADLLDAKNETGLLARRFEQYQQRLCTVLNRERDFSGDASHELRTPLAVISAATETLLMQSTGNPSLLARLQRIERATGEMISTLDALLYLSREEGGTVKAPGVFSSVAGLLNELVAREMMLRQLSPTAIHLRVEAKPTLGVSEESIRMVLSNLLRNALDHGLKKEASDKTIEVILRSHNLCVMDHGPGIPTGEIEAMIERGNRLNRDSSDRNVHGGLGLAIAKRVCRHHEWSLVLHNREKGGLSVCWEFSSSLANAEDVH